MDASRRPDGLDHPIVPRMMRAMSRAHVWLYRATGGRLGGRWRIGGAFPRGVPVLTSNVSAMPDVSGAAALLVDPTDVQSIADGLCRLATNSDLRNTLIRAGIARAKEFTWEKSVDATWKVYQELLR